MKLANIDKFTSRCNDFLDHYLLQNAFSSKGLHLSFSYTVPTDFDNDWVEQVFSTHKQIPHFTLKQAGMVICFVEISEDLSYDELDKLHKLLYNETNEETDRHVVEILTEEIDTVTIHFLLMDVLPSALQYDILLSHPGFSDMEKRFIKKNRLKQLFMEQKRSS